MLRQLTFLIIAVALGCFGPSAGSTTTNGRSDRIIGGTNADIANYPYQLSLRYWGDHYCGASIISSYWAVTAAHCCIDAPEQSLSLKSGSSRLGSSGMIHGVSWIIKHPSYTLETIDYDICLLHVINAFNFKSNNVKAIQLAEAGSTVPVGSNCTITGWGQTKDGGSYSKVLQVATVPVISAASCQASLVVQTVTPRMICAGYAAGGKDACLGDGGSPMALNNELVGVASWGDGCARPNKPGVYTKVSELRAWIKKNSGV